MYVIPSKEIVIFQTRTPNPVLETIPTAKLLSETSGAVAVPHGLEESIVLNNLGVKTPSPIQYYYNWPGRYKPLKHQIETASFLTMNKRAAVLNEIGTGKTLSSLWAADYLMQQGLIKKVLIISPLSTLERVWGDALFTNFPDRTFGILYGTAAKRKKLLGLDYQFYVINHDGFGIIAADAIGKFDLIIVDEAAVLRNPSTKRFKLLSAYMRHTPNCRLWLMTGTPTPNSPLDAWALAKLLGQPVGSYGGFREQVMRKVSQYKWVPRDTAIAHVKSVLTPAVRFTRDECLDLPDTVIQTRKVELTQEQKKAYNAMLKHFIAEAKTGVISAANEAVKMQKLIQIACGVVYDDSREIVSMNCLPRITATKEVIEEAGGKVIIFTPFVSVLNMLRDELKGEYSVDVVSGSVSAGERSRIFNDFQNGNLQILLAHPGTMAHGLTLTAAKSIIWYGPITSNETYTQACGRTERIGKKHVTSVVHIEATPLETRIYERLKDKQRLQGILLDIIKGD